MEEIKHVINEREGFLYFVMLERFGFLEDDDHEYVDEFFIIEHRKDESLEGFRELRYLLVLEENENRPK